jgi:FkbM family methyltransferase
MNYSNPILLKARYFLGRKLDVLRPIVRLTRRIRRQNYEANFDAALMKSIRPGYTVWDVGANEGFYTHKFSEAVESGSVIDFEPSPGTFGRLQTAFAQTANVRLENMALADKDGEVSFFVSDNSVTDSLFNKSGDSRTEVTVRAIRADNYPAQYRPNVVKVDVEGFELEVLRGMSEILLSENLKYIFIEVHFMILADRGQADAPMEIVHLIKRSGMKVDWLDPSHLVASRE